MTLRLDSFQNSVTFCDCVFVTTVAAKPSCDIETNILKLIYLQHLNTHFSLLSYLEIAARKTLFSHSVSGSRTTFAFGRAHCSPAALCECFPLVKCCKADFPNLRPRRAAVSSGVIPSAAIHRSEGHGGVPGLFRKRTGRHRRNRKLCV